MGDKGCQNELNKLRKHFIFGENNHPVYYGECAYINSVNYFNFNFVAQSNINLDIANSII